MCIRDRDPKSMIGPFLRPATAVLPAGAGKSDLFAEGRIHLSTDAIHTVHPLEIDIPKGRLTVVTGVSGSGKPTLILESLVPALAASPAAVSYTHLPCAGIVGWVYGIERMDVRTTFCRFYTVQDKIDQKLPLAITNAEL